MGVLSWILMGLVVGVLAKLVLPGPDAGGFIVTIVIGIAGAAIGGFIGTTLGLGDVQGFNLHSILLAVVGAVVLLLGLRALNGRSRV